MDWKLELVTLPVTDVDRARDFYAGLGWSVDYDVTVSEDLRFVQVTGPGSGCSIAFGVGMTDAQPGSVKGLQVVVDDIQAAHEHLQAAGIDPGPIQNLPWGDFVGFSDPDGNTWAVQDMTRIKAERAAAESAAATA